MAAPTDAGRASTNVSTAATTWTVNYPASIAAGDLLILLTRTGSNGGTVTLAGWTQIINGVSPDACDDFVAIFSKVADGSETGTFSVTMAGSEKGGAIVYRVSGAQAETPAVSTVATGTTSADTASSTSVAPNSAPQDTLYITWGSGDGEVGAYTAAPTNYTNLVTANSGTGGAASSNILMGAASRQISASSSDDAGTFTHAAHTTGWSAYALAIRPSASVFIPPQQPLLMNLSRR